MANISVLFQYLWPQLFCMTRLGLKKPQKPTALA